MKKVGIIGASGYTGAELLRLCAQHPEFEVAYATGDSQAGTLASGLYPSLAAHYPNLVFAGFWATFMTMCVLLLLDFQLAEERGALRRVAGGGEIDHRRLVAVAAETGGSFLRQLEVTPQAWRERFAAPARIG